MKHFFLLLVFIPIISYAQLTNLEKKIGNAYLLGNYEECIMYYETFYEKEKDYNKSDSRNIMTMVAISYLNFYKDAERKQKGVSLLQDIKKYISNGYTDSTPISDYVQYITENHDSFGKLLDALHVFDALDGKNESADFEQEFDEIFWKNLKKLNPYNHQEAEAYIDILRIKSQIYISHNQVINVNNDILPKLYDIIEENSNEIIKKYAYNILNTIYIQINNTEQGGYATMNAPRLNCFLNLNELALSIQSKNRKFRSVRWQDVRDLLTPDDCAVIINEKMTSFLGKTIKVYSFIGITFDCISPIHIETDFLKIGLDLSRSIREELINKFPTKKRFYILNIGTSEMLDIAGCDQRFFIKYSLLDINKTTDKTKYDGNTIEFAGDFDFKEGGSLDNLEGSQREYNYFRDNFGSKLLDNARDKFAHSNLLSPPQDTEILHISTHGIDSPHGDLSTLMSYLIGDFASFGLALPGYNENNHNWISGEEIAKGNFSDVDLAFINTCESAKLSTVNGINSSLSKAFYSGGCSNVISYLTKVEDKIAENFTYVFYDKIKQNPNNSYHTIFYETKKEIEDKYKTNVSAILWE